MKKLQQIQGVLALVLCGVAATCMAGLNDDGDWQFWTYDSATVKLTDRTALALDGMLRYGDDMSELWYWHADVGLVFKVNKHLALKPSYRHKAVETGPKAHPVMGDLHEWRYVRNPSINAILSAKPGGWKIKNVCRLAYWDFDDDFQELGAMRINTDRWLYRNITAVIPPVVLTGMKLMPFAKEDVFVDLKEGEVNRNRLSAGLIMGKYKTAKPSLYYMWEATDWSEGGWRDINIVGIDVTMAF